MFHYAKTKRSYWIRVYSFEKTMQVVSGWERGGFHQRPITLLIQLPSMFIRKTQENVGSFCHNDTITPLLRPLPNEWKLFYIHSNGTVFDMKHENILTMTRCTDMISWLLGRKHSPEVSLHHLGFVRYPPRRQIRRSMTLHYLPRLWNKWLHEKTVFRYIHAQCTREVKQKEKKILPLPK